MSEVKELLNKKENLILEITNRLMTWDDSVEDAIEILETNDQSFKDMQTLDAKIPEEDLNAFNQRYKDHWLRMITIQQELIQTIEKEQQHTQGQLAQIDKKQKVVSNYMALKNRSIFIEKDY